MFKECLDAGMQVERKFAENEQKRVELERLHEKELEELQRISGLTQEQAKDKFGFFLEAFKYGTPPHGGVGIGLERLVMILAGTDNIRDVVAFPKIQSASDLMND